MTTQRTHTEAHTERRAEMTTMTHDEMMTRRAEALGDSRKPTMAQRRKADAIVQEYERQQMGDSWWSTSLWDADRGEYRCEASNGAVWYQPLFVSV